VTVDGSSTVYRISMAAQEAYDEEKPGARIVVDYHGTGGGFGRYIQGEVDIVDASRAAKPDEEAQAKQKGFAWTRFLVGHDGITVVVNPRNDFVKSLTVEQLKRLWEPGSQVRTWKDLDPSWPNRKINLYSPDDDSGTFDFFTEAVVGKAKAQRQDDVQASSDDNVLVTGVEGDPDGLGYFGYAYYAAQAQRLRAVPIRNGTGAEPVLPSPETILSGAYAPLARPLYIYVKNAAMQRPEVADFVTFYIQRGADLAHQGGYVPPTDSELAVNRDALKGLTSGGMTAEMVTPGPAPKSSAPASASP
jgi:phosphate transport system substrate-binding protein